jgi:multidrug efflux pump subunit AcrA (membrane-fusion protein)
MRRYATGIVTIAAIVLLIAGTVWFSRSRPALENAGGKAAPVDIALVKTGHPERRNFTLCCRWFGRVESKRTVEVVAPEAGQVVSIEAQEGALVKKGEALLSVAGSMEESRLKTRQQSVASPATGIVTNRRVNIGQDVEKGAHLADIISPTDLRIVASFSPSADIPLEGRTAVIYSTKGETIPGIVVKVIPQRTLSGVTFIWTIWIEGDAINRQMKLGETASGEIPLHVRRNVLALPANAIVRDEQERPFVFLNLTGGYRKQPVKTGITSEGWVEVVSDIPEGAEVVVQGAYELFYKDFSKIYKVAD